MRKALIVVDICEDFVADNGKLTVGKPAQDIVPFILEQMQQTLDDKGVVVFATDNHPEGKDGGWPPHCDPNTNGVKPFGPLNDWYETNKENSDVIYSPKSTYNAFWQTGLGFQLKIKDVDEVKLVGVCTDICVFNTAAGAYFSGFKVKVLKAGCATLPALKPNEEAAYKMMKEQYAAEIEG